MATSLLVGPSKAPMMLAPTLDAFGTMVHGNLLLICQSRTKSTKRLDKPTMEGNSKACGTGWLFKYWQGCLVTFFFFDGSSASWNNNMPW
jgi:hypothetical protein